MLFHCARSCEPLDHVINTVTLGHLKYPGLKVNIRLSFRHPLNIISPFNQGPFAGFLEAVVFLFEDDMDVSKKLNAVLDEFALAVSKTTQPPVPPKDQEESCQ